ncbi:homoserine dehydrogenase [Actinoplanes sp. NPDC051343]|uniref:homoserine dehydrogenase n=1 Tax=Actinoplanes sp. NPDC051343 TaxID=3363906 RepID=UPI0037893CE2
MSDATEPASKAAIRLALLGCGTVGSEVVRLLHDQAGDLTARIGAPLELAGIAVRRMNKSRGDVDPALFTTDALSLIKRDDVDVVIEVVGGIEPARSWLVEALRAGKSVVTANKALLAEDGAALHDAASEGGADLYYEASVAGAIPLLRPLRESLHGDRVTRVTGIVNGTTNYILSSMDATGAGFSEALDEATELGYAEADPTADVEGFDAAAKAAILASLAFHSRVTAADVFREGMTGVTAGDMASAQEMGCTIKLLCIAERGPDSAGHESVSVRVHPAMIPRSHPLAGVGDAFNAVFVEAEAAGQLMFYGRGAGGTPTASAVLGDIVAAARNRLSGTRAPSESNYAHLPVRSIGEAVTRYHISLDVADRQGVLATVAGVFAQHEVSIATVRQSGREEDAKLVIVTHGAPDAHLAATVEELSGLDIVRSIASVLRVEGGS